MLGLKLNHVSKRGYWSRLCYSNTNIMHAKCDMNWISATSVPDPKFNTLQWKMRVPIWALGYISTLRTRNKNTAPDFWFNNPVYCRLFLFVIYSYFILPKFFMQIIDKNSSHWNTLFAVTIASVACHIDDHNDLTMFQFQSRLNILSDKRDNLLITRWWNTLAAGYP